MKTKIKHDYQCYSLRGIPKPAAPRKQVSEIPPSVAELPEVIILRKRNKSSPGTNAISYVIYKQCSKVLSVMHCILKRIWKKGKIPLLWRIGESAGKCSSKCLQIACFCFPIFLYGAKQIYRLNHSESVFFSY